MQPVMHDYYWTEDSNDDMEYKGAIIKKDKRGWVVQMSQRTYLPGYWTSLVKAQQAIDRYLAAQTAAVRKRREEALQRKKEREQKSD